MCLKYVRCDETWNNIVLEILKVHQTHQGAKIMTGVYVIRVCEFKYEVRLTADSLYGKNVKYC